MMEDRSRHTYNNKEWEWAQEAPIGVFDSGYGGLTILSHFKRLLPEYDYLYLGDNARSPYGSHSFSTIYKYTLQGVEYLFEQGCKLVILACNTASARALRSIQQVDLVQSPDPTRRVLGVIRPTVEHLADITRSGHVGIFATSATVRSNSYGLECQKIAPSLTLTQQEAPMWVPLVENGELADNEGVNYFVRREVEALLAQDPRIDAIQLACTHYPLLAERIAAHLPEGVALYGQGEVLARSLQDYLHRHPEMEQRISRGGGVRYLTTESDEHFQQMAARFLQEEVNTERVQQIRLV